MKVFLIIVAINLFLLFVSKFLEVEELKEEICRIERSRDRRENVYRGTIQSLENRIDELLRIKFKPKTDVSEDTIQAVKYAMKKSHPDNGGNAEDFTKFQKVYKELTRKGDI